ncbi:1-deoxy-D-xylulose-5-phosphate reductoisomerase [Desulfofustis limnaeus]|jgi:1-deoxy-D-xylulose-5-phosphate reductoisomerase|uniref:1-deoxy-D-xylulose 5-phosphate reductoisomerase n=1 Tax=Desulfofustis limnaeus TaxID=2740163 RepID=A0ABN6M314_9BACT|nr:1-deoxy-D-xylulose-5-phosphate reductoisomerase [Desulfofustis limnaeus]MDX9895779.1 1-deoxy-D-xylulose-5-phosphate reductoisomerase [Desulfofustis sp.]BDD86166.1 1-deoxy-D-xylulose 5-phosphate reductoisomerase [Desulfofustis limnaeus]
MKRLSVLGSTGSIGVNVLSLVRQFPDRFDIVGLAAGKNLTLLAEQVREFRPLLISVQDEEHAEKAGKLLPEEYRGRIVYGVAGMEQVAALAETDMTVSAVVGAAGLLPTIAAIEAGKDVGLANKETLVVAGRLVMEKVRAKGIRLLPIDSEHSAIFQALEAGRKEDVARIILTASGGPFLHKRTEELGRVSRDEALNHPNWSMGPKITIDSATLMNKGLEVIEARWLFDMVPATINVVVHPQSIVHSLVEFRDGSVLAQLGLPDMRIPIAYALSYPERMTLDLQRLNLWQCAHLEFYEPDYGRFPALRLAFEALERGGTGPAVLNGANEVAVAAFLEEKISFLSIAAIVEQTLAQVNGGSDTDLDVLLAADREARRCAESLVATVAA